MADSESGGGRRYVVLAVVIMLLAALPFSPFVSFRSSQHIDTESASLDSNLPTKDSDNDGLPDWWEMEFNLDPFDASDALLDSDQVSLLGADFFTLICIKIYLKKFL